MANALVTSGSKFSEDLVDELAEDKEARDAYAADKVRARLALLIRALREQPDRRWTQAELGQRMAKAQNVVSRIENPDYGKLTLQTLFEVAAAFDLPLWVDMPEWDDWLVRSQEVEAKSLRRTSFNATRIKNSPSCDRQNSISVVQTGKYINTASTYNDLLSKLGLGLQHPHPDSQNISGALVSVQINQNAFGTMSARDTSAIANLDINLLNA